MWVKVDQIFYIVLSYRIVQFSQTFCFLVQFWIKVFIWDSFPTLTCRETPTRRRFCYVVLITLILVRRVCSVNDTLWTTAWHRDKALSANVNTFLILYAHMGNQMVQVHTNRPPKTQQRGDKQTHFSAYCCSVHLSGRTVTSPALTGLFKYVNTLKSWMPCFFPASKIPRSKIK